MNVQPIDRSLVRFDKMTPDEIEKFEECQILWIKNQKMFNKLKIVLREITEKNETNSKPKDSQ